MEINLMTREEKRKQESDEMFYRSLNELEEQSCLNKLNSGMDCSKNCAYYGTVKCRHPEKVFPQQKRY